jgi:hypothetical protein
MGIVTGQIAYIGRFGMISFHITMGLYYYLSSSFTREEQSLLGWSEQMLSPSDYHAPSVLHSPDRLQRYFVQARAI